LPVTVAQAAGVILQIILWAFGPVIRQIEMAFISGLEMDIPSGTHIARECASQCLTFRHEFGGLSETLHVYDFQPAKNRNVPS
jgi:hypothetical protein